jgi:hypothetical protein
MIEKVRHGPAMYRVHADFVVVAERESAEILDHLLSHIAALISQELDVPDCDLGAQLERSYNHTYTEATQTDTDALRLKILAEAQMMLAQLLESKADHSPFTRRARVMGLRRVVPKLDIAPPIQLD